MLNNCCFWVILSLLLVASMMMTRPDQDSDALLLLQLQQGNTLAFDALYAKHWEKAYASAYKRLKDEDQAKDVVQEIFINIWTNRECQIENLPAYLHVAVRNKVFKIAEKQKITQPFLEFVDQLPSAYMHADADILWKEFKKAYEDLLDTLPPKRQIIFRMRFQEDLTTTEIAEQLGLSRKTVQNQLGKAIEQLRISFMHLFTLLIVLLVK
jgi:RNA polymerase sigma-70 factor (family 1)